MVKELREQCSIWLRTNPSSLERELSTNAEFRSYRDVDHYADCLSDPNGGHKGSHLEVEALAHILDVQLTVYLGSRDACLTYGPPNADIPTLNAVWHDGSNHFYAFVHDDQAIPFEESEPPASSSLPADQSDEDEDCSSIADHSYDCSSFVDQSDEEEDECDSLIIDPCKQLIREILSGPTEETCTYKTRCGLKSPCWCAAHHVPCRAKIRKRDKAGKLKGTLYCVCGCTVQDKCKRSKKNSKFAFRFPFQYSLSLSLSLSF